MFHNGEPINADAVVFTFDRAKKLFDAGQGDLTFALAALKYDHMEKIDDLTVKLVMKEPDPIITSHMVNPGTVDPAAEILLRAHPGRGRLRARWAPAATSSCPTSRARAWCSRRSTSIASGKPPVDERHRQGGPGSGHRASAR